MSTKKQMAANKRNADKSTGPGDTSRTRFNAIQHGLLSKGLTQLDDKEMYDTVLAEQRRKKKPADATEDFFVSCLALYIVKLKTCQRLVAEYATSVLNPTIFDPNTTTDSLGLFPKDLFPERRVLDPGIPARLPFEVIERITHTFDRYEKEIFNRYLRVLHELERMQRARQGENVPPPIVADISFHTTSSSSAQEDQHPSPESAENAVRVPFPGPVHVTQYATNAGATPHIGLQNHSSSSEDSGDLSAKSYSSEDQKSSPESAENSVRVPLTQSAPNAGATPHIDLGNESSSSKESGGPSTKSYGAGSNNGTEAKKETLQDAAWQKKTHRRSGAAERNEPNINFW